MSARACLPNSVLSTDRLVLVDEIRELECVDRGHHVLSVPGILAVAWVEADVELRSRVKGLGVVEPSAEVVEDDRGVCERGSTLGRLFNRRAEPFLERLSCGRDRWKQGLLDGGTDGAASVHLHRSVGRLHGHGQGPGRATSNRIFIFILDVASRIAALNEVVDAKGRDFQLRWKVRDEDADEVRNFLLSHELEIRTSVTVDSYSPCRLGLQE